MIKTIWGQGHGRERGYGTWGWAQGLSWRAPQFSNCPQALSESPIAIAVHSGISGARQIQS